MTPCKRSDQWRGHAGLHYLSSDSSQKHLCPRAERTSLQWAGQNLREYAKGWRPSLQIIRGCTIFLAQGDCEKGRGSSANGSGGENASVVQEQVVRLHTGNRQHTARGTVLGSRHVRN